MLEYFQKHTMSFKHIFKLKILSNINTKGFVIDGVTTEIPINITPAPNPTCCKDDRVGRSKKSYKTPNNTPNPTIEIIEPNKSLASKDFLCGVETLSLIASIGLTCEAFLAGSREEKIVTVIPIINPVIAASVVRTKGPSGRPNSKYCNPSLTATASPIPKAIPSPDPIIDINKDSDMTNL